jgi:glycine/D-amino acid oxidase-like deaminating enzyme
LTYRSLSLWHDLLTESLEPREVSQNRNFDILILGAGYTGLWTALYLLKEKPNLKVAILEKEIAGFGASGRNGGWCSALFPWSAELIAKRYGFEHAVAVRSEMVQTVTEIERVTQELAIDCDFQRSGTFNLIRSKAQQQRAKTDLEQSKKFAVDKLQQVERDKAPLATGTLSAVFDPACASIQPAKLARGLANKVVQMGAELFEQTQVLDFGPSFVKTNRGEFKADYVIDAMEGYRSQLPRRKRDFLPLYSLMIATEPIDEGVLDDLRLTKGITFADYRNLIIYGQRTADNRIAFGGRGAPYHFGSTVRPEYEQVDKIHRFLEFELKALFPKLKDVRITHRWGGALAVSRDWLPTVKLDSVTKIGQAGGYVGDGVGTSNLAGRIMTDLILGRKTSLTSLCFVNHTSPKWEVEPLRFIAARGAMFAARVADQIEQFTGRNSLISKLIGILTGKR